MWVGWIGFAANYLFLLSYGSGSAGWSVSPCTYKLGAHTCEKDRLEDADSQAELDEIQKELDAL